MSQIMGGGIMPSSSHRRKDKKDDDGNYHQYPKVPSGFQCFVCGKQFATNDARIQHLEEDPHGSLYDTVSPQEREENRRLKPK
jgi:hypothetical protein